MIQALPDMAHLEWLRESFAALRTLPDDIGNEIVSAALRERAPAFIIMRALRACVAERYRIVAMLRTVRVCEYIVPKQRSLGFSHVLAYAPDTHRLLELNLHCSDTNCKPVHGLRRYIGATFTEEYRDLLTNERHSTGRLLIEFQMAYKSDFDGFRHSQRLVAVPVIVHATTLKSARLAQAFFALLCTPSDFKLEYNTLVAPPTDRKSPTVPHRLGQFETVLRRLGAVHRVHW